MRTKAIAAVGIITLFGTLALSFYSSVPMLVLSLTICVAISLGFCWQGHKVRHCWIATSSNSTAEYPAGAKVRIEGREFPAQDVPSRLDFSVHTRNMHLLLAIAVIPLASLVSILTGRVKLFSFVDPSLNPYAYWFYSGFCYLLLLLLLPVGEWVFECALMRQSAITLANVQSQGKLIRYDFRGPQGGYHGGSGLNFDGSNSDNLKVVVCSPANPDANRVSAGMLFHKITWVDAPRAN